MQSFSTRVVRRTAALLAGPLLAGALLLAMGPVALLAEGLRIETKMYVDEEEEPVSENLTLFHEGVVYDFLFDPSRIAVFRGSAGRGGRFILLNPSDRTRTELRTEQIQRFLVELRAWAGAQKDPLLKFSASPKFEEVFREAEGELRLTSDVIRYTIKTIPAKDAQELARYREFGDWYARLGSMTHVGSLPPFPRLAVNAALDRHACLPTEVQLTIPARGPFRDAHVSIRAVHRIGWRLSREDLARMDQVGNHLVNFRSVGFDEFQTRQ